MTKRAKTTMVFMLRFVVVWGSFEERMMALVSKRLSFIGEMTESSHRFQPGMSTKKPNGHAARKNLITLQNLDRVQKYGLSG